MSLCILLLRDSVEEKKHRKKCKKIQWATNKLRDLGVDLVERNNGTHLIIFDQKCTYDFYPSTGKYKSRDCTIWKRGFKNLIKDMGLKNE